MRDIKCWYIISGLIWSCKSGNKLIWWVRLPAYNCVQILIWWQQRNLWTKPRWCKTFHQRPTNIIVVAQILSSMGARKRSQKESHTWDGDWSQTLVLINASVSSSGAADKLCRSFGKLTHYSVTSYSAAVKRKAHPAARLGRRWAEVASRVAERCSRTGLTRYSGARRTSWRQASGGSQELVEAWNILYSTLWSWIDRWPHWKAAGLILWSV